MADVFTIIGTRLTADTVVGGVNEPEKGATAGFHRGQAPQNAGYPRVVIKDVTGLPVHTASSEQDREITIRRFIQFMVYTADTIGNTTETATARCSRLVKRLLKLFADADGVVGDSTFTFSRLDRQLPQQSEHNKSLNATVHSEGVIFEMWEVV